MDSLFRDILYDISDSCTNCDGCRCPGHIYNFSYRYPVNDYVRKTEAAVRYIVSKYGSENIHLSVHTIWGTSDEWDELNEIRQRILDKINIFVSPVTWNPTKKFRYDMFCFGYFPFFQKFDFKYSKVLENKEIYSFTPEGLNEAESCRIDLMKSGKYVMAPTTYYTDYGTDTVCFRIKEITNGVENDFNLLGDDSKYDESLTPKEFVEQVIRDNDLFDDYYPEYKLICTKQINKAENVFRVLKKRLSISDYIFLKDFDYYKKKDGYKDSIFNKVAFSYDDSIIDRTSGHFDIFRIPKSHNI